MLKRKLAARSSYIKSAISCGSIAMKEFTEDLRDISSYVPLVVRIFLSLPTPLYFSLEYSLAIFNIAIHRGLKGQ